MTPIMMATMPVRVMICHEIKGENGVMREMRKART